MNFADSIYLFLGIYAIIQPILGYITLSIDLFRKENILYLVQIFSLIFLIIYVWKTWNIASATKDAAVASQNTLAEMRNSRDLESAPYVITYFEPKSHVFYLVIKNIGKTVAKDIKLEFSPALITSMEKDISIANSLLINEGINSLAPGQEIKIFFDTAPNYLNRPEFPSRYDVTIRYTGGINNVLRISKQILDLSIYKGLILHDPQGLDSLTKEVKELVSISNKVNNNLGQISGCLDNGIILKNINFNENLPQGEEEQVYSGQE